MIERRGRRALIWARFGAMAALAAPGCTGSPDSVTLFGARGVSRYDTPNGAPAFNGDGYGYGAALTWALPTTRSMRLDDQTRDLLEAVEALQRDQHDLLLLREQPTPVIVTTPAAPTVELPPGFGAAPQEDGLTLQIKGLIGLAAAAMVAVLAAFMKKKFNLSIPSISRKKKKSSPTQDTRQE